MKTCLITAKDIEDEIKGLTKVVLGLDEYHTSECLSLLLQYQLTHGSGKTCPPIGKNSPEELEKLNWNGEEIRENSFPDELTNIGVDFEVITLHKCRKIIPDRKIIKRPVDEDSGFYSLIKSILLRLYINQIRNHIVA